uniref:Uncharacterized protein n=1 Tax=viral metagenome TaxID=1070528 RepID=A0A6C0LJK9_9ZZZZ
MGEQTEYHFHNSYHLGDNVFNLIFFNTIRRYYETKNIIIHYYCKKCYISQLVEFIDSNHLILKPLHLKPRNSIELWVNNRFFPYNHDLLPKPLDFNNFYVNFFNVVVQKLNFRLKLNKLEYRCNRLLDMYDNHLSDKYKNIDILFLNSKPLSGQFDYNQTQWDNYIKRANKLFNVCTTTKVDGVKSTADDKLTIKFIATISTHVPVIIAINSGVLPGLLNKYTLSNVKRFYTFDNRSYYSYPNFVSKSSIEDIKLSELKPFIKKK